MSIVLKMEKKLQGNYPSLCIPRVFKNISREYIETVFTKLNIGTIEKIDIIPSKEQHNSNLVFIHLFWNQTENSKKARERLLTNQDIKVHYDEPWFWKVIVNKSKQIKSN
jgi:hypothetical protein